MQAVILAGGFGTRLRPLTYTIPKPLLPLAGEPMVKRLIDAMPEVVDEVILTVGYMAEMVEEFFKEHDVGKSITVVREEEPLGTGGAVKNVEKYVDDVFLVFNADVVSSLNTKEIVAYHCKKSPLATVSLFSVEDPTAFGMVNLDENGRILSFVEKPKREEVTSHLINAGTYVLDTDVLDYIPPKRMVSLEREVYPHLLETERGMCGFPFSGFWTDAGTLENYLKAQHFFIAKMGIECCAHSTATILGRVERNVYLGREVYVGKRAKVSNSAVLEHVSIGEGAEIEGCIIGPGAVIKPNTFIKDCIIGEGAKMEGTHVGERYGYR